MAGISPNPVQNWGSIIQSTPLMESEAARNQALTGLVQQQTVGAGIANQLSGLNLGLFRGVLQNFEGQMGPEGQAPSAPGGAAPVQSDDAQSDQSGAQAPQSQAAIPVPGVATSNQSGEQNSAAPAPEANIPMNQGAIEALLRNRFFVNPAGTPQMQRNLQMAALTGNPGLLNYAKEQRDLYVKSANAQNQMDANKLYDLMNTVVSAPKGTALSTLERIEPSAAARIRAVAKAHEQQPDALARQYATWVATATHQYTGRPVIYDQAGVPRDEVTGLPLTGVPQAGLSPYAYSLLAEHGAQMVKVNNPDGSVTTEPLWKANGSGSLQQWMLRTAARQGAYAPGGAGSNMAIAQSGRAAAAVQARQQAQPQQPPGAAAPVAAADDHPVLQKALADPTFRQPAFSGPAGTGPSTVAKAEQAEIGKSYGTLYDEGAQTLDAAKSQLTYLRAAQKVLNDPKTTDFTTLGLPGSAIAEVNRLWGSGGNAATRRQEIVKYLSNAALQNARQLYGSRMTQTEVKLQLEQMNPNAHMTPKALNNLLQEQLRIAQYYQKEGQYVHPYLQATNNPLAYYQWFQQYWPMQKVANGEANPNAGSSPAATPSKAMPSEGTLQAYAAKYFHGNLDQAVAFLRTHNYQ